MFEYPHWINILIFSMPLTVYMWLLGMWATMKDNEPEEEKEEMTLIRALGTTLLCVLVGVVGFGGGSWYTSNKLFKPVVEDLENISKTARKTLLDVSNIASKESMDKNLKKIKESIQSSIEEDFNKVGKNFDDVNQRIVLLSKDIMDLDSKIKQQIVDLENSTKTFVDEELSKGEEEVKKQLGEMYDKVDVLYKDLAKISETIDTAKETFLGKYIIK